jgi:hypothetical protein
LCLQSKAKRNKAGTTHQAHAFFLNVNEALFIQ